MRRLEPAFLIDGPNVSISGATWKGFLLFRLKAPNASIFLRDTCFRFGSWTRNVGFAEFYACRDAEEWSSGKAESRAKDEVLVAMLEVERAARRDLSISAYIDKFKDKQVLVLGDYGPEGIGRLESISHALISRGYEPILVKDIPEHPHNDILQKVVAVGSVSRFVVVDDSSKSGHIAEFERCKQNDWLTIVLRAEGHRGSWMTAGATIASKVILELEYDPSSPNAAIEAAVEWAEATLRERLVKLDETYPWRSN
jgi:hypothetical protein